MKLILPWKRPTGTTVCSCNECKIEYTMVQKYCPGEYFKLCPINESSFKPLLRLNISEVKEWFL
jgi:hypothetical protein